MGMFQELNSGGWGCQVSIQSSHSLDTILIRLFPRTLPKPNNEKEGSFMEMT
jgi:hypothetical protein